ncbi:MAG: hypothetical protein M0Q13_05975 [Methanothrix sp.]|jgi:hypothetical protein|nr:hypothetical protein [Methanothrix sp.]
MTFNAGFGQSTLESIRKSILLRIKRMAGNKHCDLILVFSVSLGFGMLFVFSAAN